MPETLAGVHMRNIFSAEEPQSKSYEVPSFPRRVGVDSAADSAGMLMTQRGWEMGIQARDISSCSGAVCGAKQSKKGERAVHSGTDILRHAQREFIQYPWYLALRCADARRHFLNFFGNMTYCRDELLSFYCCCFDHES